MPYTAAHKPDTAGQLQLTNIRHQDLVKCMKYYSMTVFHFQSFVEFLQFAVSTDIISISCRRTQSVVRIKMFPRFKPSQGHRCGPCS